MTEVLFVSFIVLLVFNVTLELINAVSVFVSAGFVLLEDFTAPIVAVFLDIV